MKVDSSHDSLDTLTVSEVMQLDGQLWPSNSSADLRYLCSDRIIQFRRIPILLLLNVQQQLMAAVTVSRILMRVDTSVSGIPLIFHNLRYLLNSGNFYPFCLIITNAMTLSVRVLTLCIVCLIFLHLLRIFPAPLYRRSFRGTSTLWRRSIV